MPTPRFSITVTGPDPDSRIAKAADSAAAAWSRHLVSDAVIDWQITSTSLPSGNLGWGGSVYTASIGPNLWEPQAAHELRTGIDTTPEGPDAFAKVDPSQILSDADLEDVLLHELGHALGFDRFGDGVNKTPFEALVIDGHFTGSAAQALYGGPVPVSGPHLAVTGDLMFPGEDQGGHHITPLTLAVLNDLGLETVEAFGTIGPDTLTAKPTGGTIFAGYSDDSVAGRAGADTLYGGPGNDSIRGGKGDDLLDGGTGADTLRGDRGNDTLSGGSGADLFCFGDNDGYDVIRDFEFSLGGTSDRLQFASEPTVSVDYESYSVTYKAGGTTVVLEHFISIIPDVVTVA